MIVGGVTLPQPPRRTNYVGSGNAGDAVRGYEIYAEAAHLLPDLVRVGTTLEPEVDRCGLYVVRSPASPALVDQLERIATKPCGCRLIVDVCADLWDERAEVWTDSLADLAWWLEVGRTHLERAIRCADLVTVPHPRLAASVSALNPRVAIVPNCPNGVPTTEATLAWTHATVIAVQRDRELEG